MTMLWLEAIVLGVSVAIALPLVLFSLEVWLAVLPGRRRTIAGRPGDEAPPSNAACPPAPALHAVDAGDALDAVVVIPAHNEETGLAATLRSLLPTLPPGMRAIVIADNCTDRTASVAREFGATVFERTDPTRRGKSHALAFAIEQLRANPPQAVVFLDADCRVNAATAATLARRAFQENRPIQGLNLADNQVAGASLGGLSTLAFRFKNLVRPLGLARLGGPCHLMGTGMAVPWSLATTLAHAGNHLAEDMQWGVDLALAGHSARFSPEVGVWSALPTGGQAFDSQRTRWEQGHLATLTRQVPRLLVGSIRHARLDLFLLALDLAIPPFSLLVSAWLFALVTTSLAAYGGFIGPLSPLVLASAGGLMTLSVLAGWWTFCRRDIPFTTLLATPLYMLRKLPIYVRYFLNRGQRAWVRTSRLPTECPSA